MPALFVDLHLQTRYVLHPRYSQMVLRISTQSRTSHKSIPCALGILAERLDKVHKIQIILEDDSIPFYLLFYSPHPLHNSSRMQSNYTECNIETAPVQI